MPKKKKGGAPIAGAAADDDYDPDALLQALAGLTQEEAGHEAAAAAAGAAVPSAPTRAPEDDIDVTDESGKKLSKAARLRAKKAAAEAERERAIAEARLHTRDYAAEETAAISEKLKPRGLKVVEVPSDGNCLYRSLLRQFAAHTSMSSYQDVRALVASELQRNSSTYSAFVELEGDEDYDGYVSAVRSSSRWGGHVELQAAATATGIPITVVSATAADRVVNPAPCSPRVPVRGEEAMAVISFHERQFFAGEHYNSVEPAL